LRITAVLQPAPYLSDPAPVALSAPVADRPVLLVSSAPGGVGLNRWCIAAVAPRSTLSADSPRSPILLRSRSDPKSIRSFDRLESAVAAALEAIPPTPCIEKPPWLPSDAPFTGGLIGWIGYEFGARFERMPDRAEAAPLPALWLGLYGAAYVVDRMLGRAWWIARPGSEAELERLRDWIEPAATETAPGTRTETWEGTRILPRNPPKFRDDSLDWRLEWTPSLDPSSYRRAVERVRDYLRAGDIYQANLTVRHRREFGGDARALFARVLRDSPAPMSAMIFGRDGAVLSASPETLFDLRSDGWIETRPIKGTVSASPGNTAEAGCAAAALLASPKDRAEHVMIVDLARNDLGRVCRPGTIRVEPLMAVESPVGLHHLVSGVRGRIGEDRGRGRRRSARLGSAPAHRILSALFPGGSIVGAPKVRAMEIIHELEPVARGVYTGAIGWFGREGNARWSLAIRTMVLREATLDLHVGGGIVIDSDPELEDEECRIKGEALARAVRHSDGDSDKTTNGSADSAGSPRFASPSARPVRVSPRRD
jgi:para-aminobenzoate synthetase component 1